MKTEDCNVRSCSLETYEKKIIVFPPNRAQTLKINRTFEYSGSDKRGVLRQPKKVAVAIVFQWLTIDGTVFANNRLFRLVAAQMFLAGWCACQRGSRQPANQGSD